MNQKTKVAICGALVTVFGFFGTISTSLCAAVPVPYQGICILGGKATVEASRGIKATMPADGGVE